MVISTLDKRVLVFYDGCMNTLSEREQDVLEAVVRDYIINATPVSSERLREISDIDVSPATFRAVMGDLEETGYLVQPHTSAGRIPTQKGYRFFVDSCISYNEHHPQYHASLPLHDDPEALVHYIVSKTRLFGAYVHTEQHVYIQFGVGEALRAPEFTDRERVQEFGAFVDVVRESADAYHAALTRSRVSYAIFIEQENPVPEARTLGVVVSNSSKKGMLFIIGPSRMDYERVLRILYSLEQLS